jgi:hypothetical protein
MFIVGWIDDGSSRLPARTTRNCEYPDDLANRCVPQLGQNWRVTSLPLLALFVCSDSAPETTSASTGTSTFTVPFAPRCWQSRHQQTRVTSGWAASLKVTLPHRQRPVLSLMGREATSGARRGSRPGAGQQLVDEMQADATQVAQRRGSFELNCLLRRQRS